MSLLTAMTARVRAMFGPRAAESRMEEEFHFHVEMETKRLMTTGLSESEAKRQTLVAFGGLERHREAMRDGRGARLLGDLMTDLRVAMRGLRKRPGFVVAVILTLTIA